MKKLYTAIGIVLLICVAGTGVLLILSPDRVPMHYNFAGEVDRIGSKYENLIFPLISVAMGAAFLAAGRHLQKKGNAANEKVLLTIGLCMVIFFTLMGFFIMVKAMRYDASAAKPLTDDSILKFVSIGIGVMMVVLGTILPKVRRNGVIGVRTKWSMANDAVWQKSQRFGGCAFVIAGLCMIVLSLVLPGMWNLLMLLAVTIVASIACVAASYRYYHADSDSQTK